MADIHPSRAKVVAEKCQKIEELEQTLKDYSAPIKAMKKGLKKQIKVLLENPDKEYDPKELEE